MQGGRSRPKNASLCSATRPDACSAAETLLNTPPSATMRAGTVLPSKTEHKLVKALQKLLDERTITEDSWFYCDLYTQIMAASAQDGRANRWSASVIQHWRTIKYYIGKRLLDVLRGPIYEGLGNKGGRLPVRLDKVVRYGPANSTLKSHSKVVHPYPTLSDDDCARWHKALGECCKYGVLSFDEMKIQTGYHYIHYMALLIGASSRPDGSGGSIALKNVRDWSLDDLIIKDPETGTNNISWRGIFFFRINMTSHPTK